MNLCGKGCGKNESRDIRPLLQRQPAGGKHRGPNPGVYRLCREERRYRPTALHRPGLFRQDGQPPGVSEHGEGQRQTAL